MGTKRPLSSLASIQQRRPGDRTQAGLALPACQRANNRPRKGNTPLSATRRGRGREFATGPPQSYPLGAWTVIES